MSDVHETTLMGRVKTKTNLDCLPYGNELSPYKSLNPEGMITRS